LKIQEALAIGTPPLNHRPAKSVDFEKLLAERRSG
jgi:hypothetical protein